MMTRNKQPILVTGAHRTGTTWVGKMLAASGEAAYISEPLNVLHRPGVMRAPVPYWYQYIHEANAQEYQNAFLDTLHFRYHPWLEIKSLRSGKDFLRMIRDWKIFSTGKKCHQRPLLKDPFAIFSVPWFKESLGCQVVITVRHPAAFAASLKRLDWSFDFNDLLNQRQLMDDYLEMYRPQMEEFLDKPPDIIGQASLLWRMVYQVVEQQRSQIPGLILAKHEELSMDPIGGFLKLYDQLDLHFTQQVRDAILDTSSSDNPKESSTKKVHTIQIDSRANIYSWKRHLKRDEIDRIRAITSDIANLYYPDESWE